MKQKILVMYGGKSTEHEVAIITALQVMHALIEADYTVLPLYVTKTGSWVLGNQRFLEPDLYQNLNNPVALAERVGLSTHVKSGLKYDGMIKQWLEKVEFEAVWPIFHGTNGEDGSIQGLWQLIDKPIVGAELLPASVAMDKWVSKKIAESLGIKVVEGRLLNRVEWQNDREGSLTIIKALGDRVVVKPNTLGSSIGITLAKNKEELVNAIEVAFRFSNRVLIERQLTNPIEVNIAIMGNDPYEFSATEQPKTNNEVLSFEDKYTKNNKAGLGKGMAGSKRLIPAPIKKETEDEIKYLAEQFFRCVNGRGMSRIDFMIENELVYFNEMNTIPGSMAFFLWEKTGMTFAALVKKMVELSRLSFMQKQNLISSFESNILESLGVGGKK